MRKIHKTEMQKISYFPHKNCWVVLVARLLCLLKFCFAENIRFQSQQLFEPLRLLILNISTSEKIL